MTAQTHPDHTGATGASGRGGTPEQARDEGVATAEHAADPRLILAVDAVIARWAKSGRGFSANDIRDDVPALAAHLVGGRLKAASMRKPAEIVAVGWERSSLVSTHSKPITVWRGLPPP